MPTRSLPALNSPELFFNCRKNCYTISARFPHDFRVCVSFLYRLEINEQLQAQALSVMTSMNDSVGHAEQLMRIAPWSTICKQDWTCHSRDIRRMDRMATFSGLLISGIYNSRWRGRGRDGGIFFQAANQPDLLDIFYENRLHAWFLVGFPGTRIDMLY